jgi:hypothetical protein
VIFPRVWWTPRKARGYARPAAVIGVPMSFEVDGEQHIAVTAGWGFDAQGVQSGIDKIQETNTAVPMGGTLLVFKLSGSRAARVPPVLEKSAGVVARPRRV